MGHPLSSMPFPTPHQTERLAVAPALLLLISARFGGRRLLLDRRSLAEVAGNGALALGVPLGSIGVISRCPRDEGSRLVVVV